MFGDLARARAKL